MYSLSYWLSDFLKIFVVSNPIHYPPSPRYSFFLTRAGFNWVLFTICLKFYGNYKILNYGFFFQKNEPVLDMQ